MKGLIRTLTCVVACAGMVACTGCGGHSSDDAPSSSSSSQSASEARIASSLEERAKFLLDYKDETYPRSDEQTAMLQRAVDNDGVVSRADYEAAWNNYKQCLVDKGYTSPPLVVYPNGIYDYPEVDPSVKLTEEQIQKLLQDEIYCYSVNTMNINDLYNVAFGNAGLLTDSDEATVDCFHKRGLVPSSYTKEQYLDERDAYGETQDKSTLSYDPFNMEIRECEVANGKKFVHEGDRSLPTWKPFG